MRDILQVSESTIRRDITELDSYGKCIKVFGGAIKLEKNLQVNELEVANKKILNTQEKIKIGKYAAKLIQPKDYVFIDAGTSTEYMLEFIEEKAATYVTNAFEHAKYLSKKGFVVILIGGKLKTTTEAIIGSEALLNLTKYHFNIGFYGTNGITIDKGFTTPDYEEADCKRFAIGQTKNAYILADGSKFGEVYSVTFATINDATIITNASVHETYKGLKNIIVVN